MKKLLSVITFSLLASALMASHSYVNSSVLASGSFIKIRVAESGLYALSYEEIKAWGLDPTTVKLYGYGGAMLAQDFTLPKHDDLPLVPVYFDKGADGVFNAGDKMIFYAVGSISWQYNSIRFLHTRNPYSDYGYYFLTSGEGTAPEFSVLPAPTPATATLVNTYTAYQLHEKEYINLIDRTGKSGGGREFYGEQLSPDSALTVPFTFRNLVAADNALSWYVDLAAYSTAKTTFTISMDGHSESVSVNGISTSDFYTRANGISSYAVFRPNTGDRKEITIRYSSPNNTSYGFINYIETNAVCSLALAAQQPLYFRTTANYGTNRYLRFEIANATSATQVWDITDPTAIKRLSTSFDAANKTITFIATNTDIHEYVALDPAACSYSKPTLVGKIANQNLHALSDIDYVVITPEEFLSEAQRLADAHAQYDNMTTAVVTDQQVYNEFSSGTPDATAYRWLMKMLYDRANRSGGTIQGPRYLCLFGDGSFDNRQLLNGQGGSNHLLTYQSANSLHEVNAYATDDYFGFLDDNEGLVDLTARMDIGVGRLPVNTLDEAAGVVNKLIRQMQGGNKGKWKTQLVFLADDGDQNLHTSCADMAAEQVRIDNPNLITNKLYLDAYVQEVKATGEVYPQAEARLNNFLNNGIMLLDYCGHSGYNNASSEGLITIAGIREMQTPNPAFWIFASCSFAHFDGGKTSAAEEAVLNPNGGAIAVCAATRTVYADENAKLNKAICNNLFDHPTPLGYHNRLGDAVRLGKNDCGNSANKLAYVLLGDPATSLNFPTQYQVVTSEIADTLHALDVVEVKGYIQTEEGDTANWFNGSLHITIYDKLQTVTTLDNDQPDASEKKCYTYNDYTNTLFQGQTSVRDGQFAYTFMLPKDIRYNYGNGRIVYYALDSLSGEEGVGHHHDIVVGGSSNIEIYDNEGPQIQLFLGSHAFENGGKVCETPHLYAEIADPHGINTVGNGIGHDLILIIDDNYIEPFVLNDYYQAVNNSYQQGVVSYQINALTEGLHSLSFRAWDLLNNSSTATLDFEVVKGFDPSITNLIVYPSTSGDGQFINFLFEYDRPDVAMQTDIYIYDLAGRLVQSISQRGTETVRWNISESSTPAGVYIYTIQLSSSATKTCRTSGKLIIK